MKIAVVVQGRFHAFDLVRALSDRGHQVTLFTNYPKWAVKRFGVNTGCVQSFWLHGIVSRLVYLLRGRVRRFEAERWLHPIFGRWVAKQLAKQHWDVIHGWSGVSEEYLRCVNSTLSLKLIMRGSAHIRTQGRILAQEEARTKSPMERPGPWITAREEREYELADRVVVLSTFAYRSFLEEGCDSVRVRNLPLGTSTSMFRPEPGVIEARCRRILSGEPLRVLYVGSLSFQKGILDVATVVREIGNKNFQFTLVGPMTTEVKNVTKSVFGLAEFIPKQPQSRLPEWYTRGDVFMFPTLQDGFAVVLAQAQASALPILTTTNCCGPDLIAEGETGWVLPIRSPQSFVERLRWCDSHREELAGMVRNSYAKFRPRDWTDVAADFEDLCTAELAAKRAQRTVRNGK